MTNKAALRASALHDLGARFDDALEGAQGRVSEARGAVGSFAQGAKAIVALEALVDRDVEEEKLGLEEAKVAKLWLGRSRAALENLGRQSEGRVLMTEGELRGWRSTVELTAKSHALELAQVPAARPVPPPSAEEAPEGARRPSIKARRQAEAAVEPKAPKKKAPKKRATPKRAAQKKAG